MKLEIAEDLGLADRINTLREEDEGLRSLPFHVFARIRDTRNLLSKIDPEDGDILLAEEECFLIGLRNSRMITPETYNVLQAKLSAPIGNRTPKPAA